MPAVIPTTPVPFTPDDTVAVYNLTGAMTWALVTYLGGFEGWRHPPYLASSENPLGYAWDGTNITVPDPSEDLSPYGSFVGGVYVPAEAGYYLTPQGLVATPQSDFIDDPDRVSDYKLCTVGAWSTTNWCSFEYSSPHRLPYVPEINGHEWTFTPSVGSYVTGGGIGSGELIPDLEFTLSWKVDDGEWQPGAVDTPFLTRVAKGQHVMRLRVLDEYGRVFVYFRRFSRFNDPPAARFNYAIKPGLNTFEFDATASSDGDGYIANYDWQYEHEGGEAPVVVDSTTGPPNKPVVQFGSSSAGKEIKVTLTVTDNDGATDRTWLHITLKNVSRFGSVLDAVHSLYIAANSSDDVTVTEYRGLAGFREIARIDGATNPAIFKNSRNHLVCGYTATDGKYRRAVATSFGNAGATFETSMAAPWEDGLFGDINEGAGNGEISCISRPNADNSNHFDVWFRYDDGNATWAAEPVQVGTLTNGSTYCHVRYDGTYIHVYNPTIRWRSASYGADGSWELY